MRFNLKLVAVQPYQLNGPQAIFRDKQGSFYVYKFQSQSNVKESNFYDSIGDEKRGHCFEVHADLCNEKIKDRATNHMIYTIFFIHHINDLGQGSDLYNGFLD